MPRFDYELNKTVTQGNDRVIKLIFDADVSDWSFFYTAKQNYSMTDAEADITVSPSEVLYYGDTTVVIPLSSVATNVSPGLYYHDLKLVKPDGVVHTFAKGVLTVEPAQTQRIT